MTTTDRSGIWTVYRGTRFRSRLEARWAAFFDLIRWRWVYEPFDAEGYIPDFLITGKRGLLVEVGPCVDRQDYWDKAMKPNRAVASLGRDLLVVGVSPSPGRLDSHCVAGPLGEFVDGPDGETAFDWASGLWARCYECRSIGVCHRTRSFVLRPCGHHQSGSFGDVLEHLELEQLWRSAGNSVQWKGPESIGNILLRAGAQ